MISIPEADMQTKYKKYLEMTQKLSGGMFNEDFNSNYRNESKWMQNYAVETQNSAKSMEEFAEANKKAKAAQDAHNNSLETAGLKAKVSAGFLKMLGSAAQGVAVGAIFAVISKAVEGVSDYINRVEIANEKMKNAVESYGSAKSNLDDINTRLAENNEAFNALQAKDKLTYAEKGQLEELQAITQELQTQRDIAEKDLEKSSREASQSAVDAYETQYGGYDLSKESVEEKLNYAKKSGKYAVSDGENDIAGNLAQLTAFHEKLVETEQQLKNLKDSDSLDAELLRSDFQLYTDEIQTLEEDINASLSDLEDKRQAIRPEYDLALEKKKNNETLSSDEKDALEYYEEIQNAIRLIYEYSDQNKWNAMQFSSLFNSSGIEKTKEELIEMAKAGTLTKESLSAFPVLKGQIEGMDLMLDDDIDAVQAFLDEISALARKDKEIGALTPKLNITDATKQIQNDLAPLFTTLQSAYEKIFTVDGFTLDGIGGSVLPELLSGLEKIENLDTSAVDRLFAVLANPASSANEVQTAFDQLAASYLYSTDTLENLNEETADAVTQQLEALGVTNAQTLVQQALAGQTSQLAAQKDYLRQHSQNLSDATFQELAAFIQAGIKTGDYSDELASLQIQKYLCSQTSLSNMDDINALLDLAQTAGITSKALGQLASMKARYDDAVANGRTSEALSIAEDMKKLPDDIQKEKVRYGSNKEKDTSPSTPAGSAQSPSASAAQTETKESFNLIDTLLSRLSSSFDKIKTKAENTYLSAAKRIKAYGAALGIVTQQLDTQQKAYDTYMAKADAVKLDDSWVKKVQDGSLEISEVSDSGLKERIRDYQTWYEKALACRSEIEKLKDLQAELTRSKLEVKIEKYENRAERAAGNNDRLHAWIGLKESFGGSASRKNYNAMNKNDVTQIKNIRLQNQSLKELQKTTEKGSAAWFQYNTQINSNKISLLKLKQEMTENAKAAAALAKAAADKKIEKLDRSDEILDAQIGSATSAAAKNSYLNKKSSNIDKRQKAYDGAVSKDKKNLKTAKSALNNFKSTKKNKTLLKKIQKYTKNEQEIPSKLLQQAAKLSDNGKLYNACVKYNAHLESMVSDKETAALFLETSKKEKDALALEQFQNISDEYDRKRASYDRNARTVSNQISEAQAAGKKVDRSFYDSQKAVNQQKLNTMTAQKAALEQNLSNIAYGTDEWETAMDMIQQLTDSISECRQEAYELNNTANELYFDAFEEASADIDRLISEQELLRELSAHEKKFDETGGFTESGLANLGSLAASYSAAKEKQEKDAGLLDKLQKIKASGTLSDGDLTFNSLEDLDAKIKETYAKWQGDIRETYDMQASISDFMKEKYQAELDAVNDLITARKDSLKAEKDLHDYQKSISQKTEDISSLKKRIAAYSGDTSQEGLAKLQKLQTELNEKQEDLRETEYDKYISDQEDILDKLYEEYEELNTKKMDDFMELVQEGINNANGNAAQISAYLAQIASQYGYTPSNPALSVQTGQQTVQPAAQNTPYTVTTAAPAGTSAANGQTAAKNGNSPADGQISPETAAAATSGSAFLSAETYSQIIRYTDALLACMDDTIPQLRQINETMEQQKISSPVTVSNSTQYGDISFNFSLPNVTVPDDFVAAIQSDPRVQQAIQSVSVDRINGGNRLSVQKIRS